MGFGSPSPIGIVGPGRLGQALGKLLYGLGQPVVAIAGRDVSRTRAAAEFIGSGSGGNVQAVDCSKLPSMASRILIAVPDDALSTVARELASASERIGAALHTCGSRGPEALIFLEERGTSCGTFHPLQTIATAEQGVADLPGSYFGITAASEAALDPAQEWAVEVCDLLGGHALDIPAGSRPLYHAAAVMASNYLVTMIDAAAMLFEQAGVERAEALAALAPLIRASVTNTLAAGPAQALTGPIERGDEQTVAAHLRALRAAPESLRDLYCSAGLHAVELARRKAPGTDRQIIESLLRKEQEP